MASSNHNNNMANALAGDEHKVIIIGGLGVGKTSLLLRFVHETFEDHVSRFVAEEKKTVVVSGQQIVLDIWDTAGEFIVVWHMQPPRLKIGGGGGGGGGLVTPIFMFGVFMGKV